MPYDPSEVLLTKARSVLTSNDRLLAELQLLHKIYMDERAACRDRLMVLDDLVDQIQKQCNRVKGDTTRLKGDLDGLDP